MNLFYYVLLKQTRQDKTSINTSYLELMYDNADDYQNKNNIFII
jgi:hypothetical protein